MRVPCTSIPVCQRQNAPSNGVIITRLSIIQFPKCDKMPQMGGFFKASRKATFDTSWHLQTDCITERQIFLCSSHAKKDSLGGGISNWNARTHCICTQLNVNWCWWVFSSVLLIIAVLSLCCFSLLLSVSCECSFECAATKSNGFLVLMSSPRVCRPKHLGASSWSL